MPRLPSLPASEAQAKAANFAQTLVNALDHLNTRPQTSHICLTPAQAASLAQLPQPCDLCHAFELLFLLYLAQYYVIVPDAVHGRPRARHRKEV